MLRNESPSLNLLSMFQSLLPTTFKINYFPVPILSWIFSQSKCKIYIAQNAVFHSRSNDYYMSSWFFHSLSSGQLNEQNFDIHASWHVMSVFDTLEELCLICRRMIAANDLKGVSFPNLALFTVLALMNALATFNVHLSLTQSDIRLTIFHSCVFTLFCPINLSCFVGYCIVQCD